MGLADGDIIARLLFPVGSEDWVVVLIELPGGTLLAAAEVTPKPTARAIRSGIKIFFISVFVSVFMGRFIQIALSIVILWNIVD
jgi:hypothetical protein